MGQIGGLFLCPATLCNLLKVRLAKGHPLQMTLCNLFQLTLCKGWKTRVNQRLNPSG